MSARLWGQLASGGPGGLVLVVAVATVAVTLILRLLLPRTRRHRGRGVLFVLTAATVLALGTIAFGVMGGATAGSVVLVVSVALLAAGLIGLAGLFVFDVVLARVGVDVPSVVTDLLQGAIGVAILFAFLRLAGLDLFSLVTTSAVLTAVVGLALQSTIANVFGGAALQLDHTLGYGDWIQVGERVGRIQEIGWRSTRILTKDGDAVFVPNGELVSKEVLNYSRPTGRHRTTLRVGFHYRHPPREVQRVLEAAARATDGVLAEPAPDSGPDEFGDSAVVYELQYWVGDYARQDAIADDVRTEIWYAAARAGLEFPFPTRTLLLSESRNHHAGRGIEAVQPLNSQEET